MVAPGLEGPAPIIAGKTVIGRLAETWKAGLDEVKLGRAPRRFGGDCSLAVIERVETSARECGSTGGVGKSNGSRRPQSRVL